MSCLRAKLFLFCCILRLRIGMVVRLRPRNRNGRARDWQWYRLLVTLMHHHPRLRRPRYETNARHDKYLRCRSHKNKAADTTVHTLLYNKQHLNKSSIVSTTNLSHTCLDKQKIPAIIFFRSCLFILGLMTTFTNEQGLSRYSYAVSMHNFSSTFRLDPHINNSFSPPSFSRM